MIECPYCGTPREPESAPCCDRADLEVLRAASRELVAAVSDYIRGRRMMDPGLRRTIAARLTAARRRVEAAL